MSPSLPHTLALLFAALAPVARADDHGASRVPPLPSYTQECGACHLAFPPGLLPAASWQRVMATLPRHYGADASLDATTTRELAAWLARHAGTGKRAGSEPPQDRITQAPWFLREHREVAAATWKLPAVKTAAHCVACHAQAEQGDFNEHNVRIPR
jgi:hypothetical protein